MAQVTKDKAQRYKLTLSKLDFVSLVDDPAQPNATTLLIKRKLAGATTEFGRVQLARPDRDAIEGHARFVKASDELGLAFFWAFTSTEKSGEAHYDHHGDQVAADDDMVRAAMEFMQDGGAVDEMHDYDATKARVVFAMPMTPEIAKAYGIETKQTGLMVAIKVTDEQLAKLKDKTYTGVSIAGLGTREPVEARKARVVKGMLVTDETEGHQHQIEVCDDGSLWCSWNTAAGAEYTHNHAVIRNSEGAIEILADSGHSHQLAADQPAVVIVAPTDIVVVAEAVAMRRSPTTNTPARKSATSDSPRSTQPSTVNSHTEQSTMKTAEEKLVELEKQHTDTTKRLERAERIAKMSGVHKTHFDTLAGEAQDEFLAKSNAERDAVIKEALEADPIEVEFEGQVYRKSAGPQMVALAKSAKAAHEKAEAQEIEKQATAHLGNLAGDKSEHAEIIKAIVSHTKGNLELRGKLLKVLDGANAIAKGRTVAPGHDGAGSTEDLADNAYEALTKGLTKFCAEQKIAKVWTEGLAKFQATDEGKALVKAHNEAQFGA